MGISDKLLLQEAKEMEEEFEDVEEENKIVEEYEAEAAYLEEMKTEEHGYLWVVGLPKATSGQVSCKSDGGENLVCRIFWITLRTGHSSDGGRLHHRHACGGLRCLRHARLHHAAPEFRGRQLAARRQVCVGHHRYWIG